MSDWLPSCPREKDFWWENERNSKKKTRKKNSVPVYGPLNKPCGFECRRANLNFLRPFFVANCDDLLHIIGRYTWLCSSLGILKTNSGREGVKCKLSGIESLALRPRAQKRLHIFDSLSTARGRKKKIDATDRHTLERGCVKKSQLWRRAAERKLRAGGNGEHNFQIGCGRNQPFGVSAVHGPPGLRISSSQLEIGKIYASLPQRTTS